MKRLNHDARVHLSKQLDGTPVESAAAIRQVYRSLIHHFESEYGGLFRSLKGNGPEKVVVLPSPCDDLGSILELAGVHYSDQFPSSGQTDRPLVVFAGCNNRVDPRLAGTLAGYVRAGGLLVTSDRTLAALPLTLDGVHPGTPSPPRRARLAQTPGTDGFAPAVWLAAGHVPVRIDSALASKVQVLACDVLTGEPVVVMAKAGAGLILHSVAHWYQLGPGPATAVERQPVCKTGYAVPGLTFPLEASLGLVASAQAMLSLLLTGLDIGTDVSPN